MPNTIKCGIGCLFAILAIFLLLPLETRAEEIAPPERYGRETLKQNGKYSDLVQVYDNLAGNYALAGDEKSLQNSSYKVVLEEPYSYRTNPGDEAKLVTDIYKFDYPEHFWLIDGYGCTPNSEDRTIIRISLNFDPDLYAQKSAFDSAVQGIMDSLGLTSKMSEYDRAKAVHDKLIELVEYGEGVENASNAYGAIVGQKADSSGYAKAYQYLLYKAGIQAGTATGTLKGSEEAVSWNFVRIDGEYYFTDVSADDGEGAASYKYFNITTKQMETEREIDASDYVPIPDCTATAAAYKAEDAGQGHVHIYDQMVEDEKYIKSAPCGENVIYYMSCSCGEASKTETFTSKTVFSHSFTNYVYNNDATCLVDGTKTATCSRCGAEDTIAAENTKLDHILIYVYNDDATCLADGTKTLRCRLCGLMDETSTMAAECTRLDHSFTDYVYNNDATCLVDGTETATCDYEGCSAEHTRTRAGSKTGHSYVTNEIKKPTCTEDGYILCVCSADGCEASYRNILEAAGHSFTDYAYNNDATCLEDGTKTATCSRCGKKDTIAAGNTRLGHSFTNYVYNNDATCLKNGTETALCDHEGCNETYTRVKEGSITDHIFVANGTKKPTCTEEGYTLYVCSTNGCGEYYHSDIVKATGHSGGNATCKDLAVCDVCGQKYGELAEHQYDTEHWVSGLSYHWHKCIVCEERKDIEAHVKGPEATEESPQSCTVCGYIIAPALVHEHRLTRVPAKPSTCTETGNMEYYTCSCGSWFLDSQCRTEIIDSSAVILDMKEHSFTNYVSDENATCTSNGTETAQCDLCSAVHTRTVENSMLPHDFEITVIRPGCTEGGYTRYICKNCLYTYTGNETEPLGHDYISAVTEPTCTEEGFTTHTCSRCWDEYTDSMTPALGHDWADATCTAPKTCVRCGAEAGLAAGHEASEWQTSQFEHWKTCIKESCREVVPFTLGTHSDSDYDGVCDICGYTFPEIYEVAQGENAALEYVRSDSEFLIIIDADAEKLTNVMVDGETVLRLFYTVVQGSTEVRFSGEYLKTLSIGPHTVKFIYTDGTASTGFEIKSIGAPPREETAPIKKYTEIVIGNDIEEINPSTGAGVQCLAPLFGAVGAASMNR